MKLYVVAFVVGLSAGVTITQWRADAQMASYKLVIAEQNQAAIKKARETEAAKRADAEGKADLLAKKLKEAHAVERIVTKEVIKYVKNPDSGKCIINNDWMHAHDTATASTMPTDADTAGGIDAANGRITDIEALEIVTANYAICQKRLAVVEGWQGWFRAVE